MSRPLLRSLLALLFVCSGAQAQVSLTLFDGSGLSTKPLETIETGSSLSVALDGLEPLSQVEVYLHDAAGREFSYAKLHVRQQGKDLLTRLLAVARRTSPLLYPSKPDGTLENAIDVRNEDLTVTGANFQPGSKVTLYLVDNRYTWYASDSFTPALWGGPLEE
jgi:hypothetical protein